MPHPPLHPGRTGAALAIVALLLLAGADDAVASTNAHYEAVTHLSSNCVQEPCVMLSRMPGGRYSPHDDAQERALVPEHLSTRTPGKLMHNLGPWWTHPFAFSPGCDGKP